MRQGHNPDQLAVFDKIIRDRIAGIRQMKRCQWCKNPNHPVKANGLCSHCYRWDNKQRKLSREVSNLPAKTVRDPYFQIRCELEWANEAIELCKAEGEVLEDTLHLADSTNLEDRFDNLSRRLLGRERGSHMFGGRAFYFSDFSKMQKNWIGYLIEMLLAETDRKRRHWAAIGMCQSKRNANDVGTPPE